MKQRLLTAALLLAACTAWGQVKMDLNVGLIVEEFKARQLDNDLRPAMQSRAAEQEQETVAIMVDFVAGAPNDAVTEMGGTIITRLGDLAVAQVPVANLEALSQDEDIRMLSLNYYEPTLYNSRSKTNANVVLEGTGEGLKQPYTGNGVIAGLFDVGIDPNHINFMNADMSESRFKAFYNFTGSGACARYTTPDAMKKFTTDSRSDTHGTHVCGIMAGSYKGNANYGFQGKAYTNSPNPYYGLAQSADIVGGAGAFTDANMIGGLQEMVNYAKQQGKPIVVNFSIGGLIGPHDGTSSISRGFESLGKEAIVVVAAGNDGGRNCAVSRSFNNVNKTLRTTLPMYASQYQFWNSTENRFKFELVIYSTSAKDIVSSVELPNNSSILTVNKDTPNFGANFAAMTTQESNIRLQGFVDSSNNRYQVSMIANINTTSSSSKVLKLGIRITGEKGEIVTGYTMNGEFSSANISGWQNGTNNGSISDMSTGENVICVGSFTAGKTFTLLDGTQAQLADEPADGVSTFSSFGVTNDGRRLPDLVGPGGGVISTFNSLMTGSPGYITAEATYGGRKYTWGQSSGTSMACPFVAGTIALMLEANPQLKVADVRKILSSTCTPPPASANSTEVIQWGAGKVNVYRAVKEALAYDASVGQIFDDEKRFMVNPTTDGYQVFVAGEESLTASLVDMQGRTIRAASANGAEVEISTSSMAPGVYVLTVDGPTSRYTQKVLVK